MNTYLMDFYLYNQCLHKKYIKWVFIIKMLAKNIYEQMLLILIMRLIPLLIIIFSI